MSEEKPLKETLWFVGKDYDHYNKKGIPRQSDKVYVVELYPDRASSVQGRQYWLVKASWGRRGKAFQSQVKGGPACYYNAEFIFEGLVRAKLDKGYKRWEFASEIEAMHEMTGYDA